MTESVWYKWDIINDLAKKRFNFLTEQHMLDIIEHS